MLAINWKTCKNELLFWNWGISEISTERMPCFIKMLIFSVHPDRLSPPLTY